MRAALLCLFLTGFASPAAAQGNCFPTVVVERYLKQQYNEAGVSIAVANSGALVERWQSPGGSWTLLIRTRDKRLCIVMSGENWRELDPPLQGEKIEDTRQ